MFLTTFQRFPTTPKISEDFPKLFWRIDKRIRTFSKHFPKISEEVPMMFRSHNTTSEYFLSDYVGIAMAIMILRLVTTTWYFHM